MTGLAAAEITALTLGALALGVCASAAWGGRRAWIPASLLLAAMLAFGAVRGAWGPESWWVVGALPRAPLLLLGGWGLLGLLLHRAGGVPWGVPGAFLAGAAYGGPLVVLAMGPRTRAGGRSGLRALAAVAGGLLGPLGSPVLMLLGFWEAALWLLPVALALGVIAAAAAPRRPAGPARAPGGRVLVLAAPLVWLAAAYMGPGVGLILAIAVVAAVAWREPGGGLDLPSIPPAILAACATMLLLPGGTFELLASSLDHGPALVGHWMPLLVGLGALAMGAAVSSAPAALAALLVVGAASDRLAGPTLAAAAVGVAMGSLLPLLRRRGAGYAETLPSATTGERRVASR